MTTGQVETPVGERTDSVLWRDLATLLLTVGRALDQRLHRDAGLSLPDYDVLSVLCAEPGDRMRPRDLGLSLRWEKSRLSHQLRRMDARGLVERVACGLEDGRGTLVAATPTGHRAYERGRPGYAEELRLRFGQQVDPADWDLLYALTQRLLNAAALDDPATLCAGPGPDPDC